jgi:hypothetical protein
LLGESVVRGLTDQNHMYEGIKSRLNSGNPCCRSVHSFCPPSSCLGT